MSEIPDGLGPGGQSLWQDITDAHTLDEVQREVLEQACRQRDRTDMLAPKAAEGDAGALRHERDSALAMTRLLVALRLPDARGKKPQERGTRGAYQPRDAMSALEKARAARAG